MDANPFRSTQSYLDFSPGAKWGALIASALASVCLALVFPVLYLFVDLLVTRGQISDYSAVNFARQTAFRQDWDARLKSSPDVITALAQLRSADTPDAPDWDARWRAATYSHLAAAVGHDAAEAYLPLAEGSLARPPVPFGRPLGILATVARERGSWTGPLVSWFARANGWTWRPGASGSPNVLYLTGLFVIAFALALLRGLLLYAASHWATRATIEAATRLRRAIFSHGYRVAAVAIRPDSQEEAGLVVTRRVEQIQDGLYSWLTTAVRGPVLIVLLLMLLLSVHIWLSLSLLLLAGVVWIVAGQAAAWYRRDAQLAARRVEARLSMMRESLSTVQLAKAYLMERFAQTRFERHLADLSRSVFRMRRGDTVSRPTLVTVASLTAAAMLFLAGLTVLAGDLSVAALHVKGAAIAVLILAVNRWLAARHRVAKAHDSAAEVAEFLDRRADAAQPVDAEFLQPMTRKLEFNDVSLRESGTGRMLLENVSLAVPAGEKAAIVFSDPDEAHALAYLLTRFVDPSAGEVRIDNKNIRWVTYESVRTQVALVLEDSLTFSDTVAHNIGCGDPGFTLPQIIEAAKLAHAHQFIQRLTYGYETQIGDGGVALRPGERFRIALARAFLRDPSAIVIEEPAEPLDADSLVLIDDALARFQPGHTLIFLAHRPATVKAADRVFVLQGGRLVAAGRHDDLLAGNELYRLLHFKQNLTHAGSA